MGYGLDEFFVFCTARAAPPQTYTRTAIPHLVPNKSFGGKGAGENRALTMVIADDGSV
jgi:hypothetical protein